MSEPNVVRALREEASSRPPPHQGSIVDLLIGAVAVVAIAALAYVGYTSWFAPGPSPLPVAPPGKVVAVATAGYELWTDADTARCESKARAASRAPVPDQQALANPAVTEGFAGLATMLECEIASRPERFCDPAQKVLLVGMVTDYLARVDLIAAALAVQGAPMEMMAGMSSEVAVGRDIYDMQKDQTLAFMQSYHRRVGNSLQDLARDGLIAPSDFAAFMGMGIPSAIKQLFEGVTPGPSTCG